MQNNNAAANKTDDNLPDRIKKVSYVINEQNEYRIPLRHLNDIRCVDYTVNIKIVYA